MNLIIGLLIIVCLAGSEFVTSQPVDDVRSRIFAVLLTIALVPGLAAFQTAIVLKKIRREPISFQNKQSLCRRLTLSHAMAWLAASLAIIWAFRWQDVVRGAWGMDRWPLVDECLILFPMIISLVASWFVFYELQSAIVASEEPNSQVASPNRLTFRERITALQEGIRARMAFVSIRFRLYFMLILIPVGVFMLVRDVAFLFQTLTVPVSEPVSVALSFAGLFGLVVFFPFLLLLVWKTGAIEDTSLKSDLLAVCRQNKLGVSSIRVWKTDNQIVNALVVGLVPRLRMILFSDALLNQFPPREVEAVLRHEAGHIRLWHLPTRMVFLLMPLLALAISQPEFLDFENQQLVSGWKSVGLAIGAMLGIGAYMYLVLRWLSHKMEFEADMFAIQADGGGEKETNEFSQSAHQNQTICQNRAAAMKEALLRLAAISPNDYEQDSVFHPSIRRRIDFIERVQAAPAKGNLFKTSFARRRKIMAALVIAMCVVGTFLT